MMPFTADPYPSHRLPCQADHHLRRSQACRQENCSWRSREQLAGPESTPDKILAHAPNSPMAGEQAVFLLGPLEANRAPSSGRGPSLGEIRLRKLPACPPGPTRPCGLAERPSCFFCLLTSRLLCLHSGGSVFPLHPRDRRCSKANRPSAQILCIVNTMVNNTDH